MRSCGGVAASPELDGGPDDHSDRNAAARRGLPPGGQPYPEMVDPRRAGPRPADGDPRQHHRQHRAPHRPARSSILQRRPAVGGDGLLPGLRQSVAPWGSHRRPHRSEACPAHRAGRFRLRLGAGWRIGQLRHAGHRPFRPRRLRGAPRPFSPRPLDHHLHHSGRAGEGVCHLRRYRRGGRGHWALARWHPYLLRIVAVDPVRQSRLRSGRHRRCPAVAEERQGRRPRPALDIPGLLLVTGGLFSLVYGLSHAETTAWSNPYTIGFLVLGVVLLAAFAYLETRTTFPLLPPRVVRNRTRGGPMLAMLFASIGIFGVFLFLTYYLQGTLGFSPVKTGVAFLPMVAALAGMAQVSNRVLLPKIGPKIIVPIGLLMDAVAMYLLHLVGLHSSYVSHVFPYLILLGLGFGLSLAPSFSTGTLGLQPHDAGVGSATLNTSQQVGGSIGTALLNTLAAGAATAYLVGRVASPANLRTAALHSYTTAFLWSSIMFVAGAVIAGLVFERGTLKALAGSPGGAAEPLLAHA